MENSDKGEWDFIWQNMSDGMARNPGRDFRYKQILKLLPNKSNLKVLDFGCGTGNLLSLLVQNYPQNQYFGIDSSDEALRKTNLQVPRVKTMLLKIVNGEPEFNHSNLLFDVVICSEVLEHIADEKETVKLLHSLLVHDGLFICTVPAGPMSSFDRYIGHHRHYSQKSLQQVLSDGGFREIEIQRSGFPAINLLRFTTILYGKRIIQQLKKVDFGAQRTSGMFVRIMRYFFKYSLADSPMGWQLVARAGK